MSFSGAQKDKLQQGSGELILLQREVHPGEQMWLAVRKIGFPFDRLGDNAQYRSPFETLVLFDIYALTANGISPVGHIDWQLEKGISTCLNNLHPYVDSVHEQEAVARKAFGHPFDPLAFYVQSRFGKRGVGQFLIASSAILLQAEGIDQIRVPYLTELGEKAWNRFEVLRRGSGVDVRTEEIVLHKLVKQSLTDFF